MSNEWSDQYSDETGRAVRLAQWFPDWVYLVALVASAALSVPAAATPEHQAFLWLAVASVTVAAFSAAGLALKARPRRLVKSWKDLAWDKQVANLPGFGYTSEASGTWLIRATTHRKGRFPSVRLLARSSKSADWDASTFTDMTITNDGDVVIKVGVERTSGDDGSELMLIIA